MTSEADDILGRSREIRSALNDPHLGANDRRALETELTELRDRARRVAAERRHPDSVAAEVDMIEARLAEIEQMSITKGYSEKHLSRTVQDPGAYRYAINDLIEQEHAEEVEYLTSRLAELRALGGTADPNRAEAEEGRGR